MLPELLFVAFDIECID